MSRGGKPSTRRTPSVRVRTARGRSTSSTRWLQRQLNDPYVVEAKRLGYRSRAAFKLRELDDRFRFLGRGRRIVDLGAAPGGWTQISAERVGKGGQPVVAIDIQPMDPLPGSEVLELDAFAADAVERIGRALGGPADVVLSDMAPSTVGHTKTDQLRIVALADAAYDLASQLLAPGGAFVVKLFQGGAHAELLDRLKEDFEKVRHAKPNASRKDSSEIYLVAIGFRGGSE